MEHPHATKLQVKRMFDRKRALDKEFSSHTGIAAGNEYKAGFRKGAKKRSSP